MKRHGDLARAVGVGSIVGMLVLGLVGRAATAALAAAENSPLNLSLPGVLESMLVGLVVGACGGLLALALRRAMPTGAGWLRGLAQGAVLFHATLFLAWFTGSLALRAELPATLIVVAALFVVQGILVDRLLPEHTQRGPMPAR